MTAALTLKCRDSFAPGFEWSAELTFKPLKHGLAVTGQLAEDEEAGVRRIVGKSNELLTRRSACAWLEPCRYRPHLRDRTLHAVRWNGVRNLVDYTTIEDEHIQ